MPDYRFAVADVMESALTLIALKAILCVYALDIERNKTGRHFKIAVFD